MLRTIPRVLVAVGVMAAAATAAGCGGDKTADKAQACANIQQELQALVQTATQQGQDRQALAEPFRNGATRMRDEGAAVKGDVEQVTAEAATALEQLADRMASGGDYQSELAKLIEVAPKFQAACSP